MKRIAARQYVLGGPFLQKRDRKLSSRSIPAERLAIPSVAAGLDFRQITIFWSSWNVSTQIIAGGWVTSH